MQTKEEYAAAAPVENRKKFAAQHGISAGTANQVDVLPETPGAKGQPKVVAASRTIFMSGKLLRICASFLKDSSYIRFLKNLGYLYTIWIQIE